MPVIWRHHGFDQPCVMCALVENQVFEDDYLGYLGPPLHPHDHCALEPLMDDREPTTLDWSAIGGAVRRAWVRLTAWILRREQGFHFTAEVSLPPILEPLRAEAEAYNKDREERLAAGEQVEEDEFMPDLVQRIRLSAALLVEQGEHQDQIPMRFVRAGQTLPLRGFPKGVVFSAAALQEAVERGLFDGAGVFFQHVDSGRDVRDLAGVTAGAAWDEAQEAVVGVVHLFSNQAGRELQALASDFRRHKQEGIPHPDIGVSIDSYFVFERAGDVPRAVRMSELLSVDVVFRPAADGRILASRASQTPNHGGIEMLTRERVEEVLEEHGVTGDVRRVLLTAEYADEASLLEAIQSATAGTMDDRTTDDGAAPSSNGSAPTVPQPVAAAMVPERVDDDAAGVWVDALRREAVNARLAGSGLPAVVRQRLAATNYDSPEQLDAAVQAARDELAALAENEVISIGGQAPRGRVSGMRNGVDRVAAAWDWIFGVPDAGVPDPQLRDVRALYHLMTGDYEFRGVYNADRVQLTGATTATLADIAANAMNKVIMAQFSVLTHWRWYERVAFPTANDGSVHDMQWTTIGGISNVPEVPEKGAYSNHALSAIIKLQIH